MKSAGLVEADKIDPGIPDRSLKAALGGTSWPVASALRRKFTQDLYV